MQNAEDFRIWWFWEAKGLPRVETDYDEIDIKGSEYVNGTQVRNAASRVLNLKTRSKSGTVEQFCVIPEGFSGHLIRNDVVATIQANLDRSLFQLLPARIKCGKAHVVDTFSLLSPITCAEIVDVEQSEVELQFSGERFFRWDRLVPFPKGDWPDFFCELRGGMMVVSTSFMQVLKPLVGTEKAFVRVEDLKM